GSARRAKQGLFAAKILSLQQSLRRALGRLMIVALVEHPPCANLCSICFEAAMRKCNWRTLLGSFVPHLGQFAALAALLLGIAVSAQADPNTAAKSEKDKAAPARILLRGGTVIDGSGQPGKQLDVLVEGERIAEIGQLQNVKADRTIDCTGLLLVPGFIDLHNHSDSSVLGERTRNGRNYLTQGC